MASTAITGSATVTVTLYKSSSPNILGTAFGSSLVLNSSTQQAQALNFSSSFQPGVDYLQVQVVVGTAQLPAGCDISIILSTY